jgi:hypothetical protein
MTTKVPHASDRPTVARADSKTAIVATIAAELAGVPVDEQSSWFATCLGVDIGHGPRRDASRLRKALSGWDQKRGRKSEPPAGPSTGSGWFWDTVAVDIAKLDIQQALLISEPLDDPGPVVEQLEATVGVAEIFEMYPGGRRGFGDAYGATVIARMLWLGAQRRSEIDSRLRELGVTFEWLEVRSKLPRAPFAPRPAALTWGRLARQFAELEGYAVAGWTQPTPGDGRCEPKASRVTERVS